MIPTVCKKQGMFILLYN